MVTFLCSNNIQTQTVILLISIHDPKFKVDAILITSSNEAFDDYPSTP